MFRLALGRLKPPRWLVIVEIILWTVLAVYLGWLTFQQIPSLINWWVFKVCYWIIIGITPISVGALVYKAHFISTHGEEVLKSTPISPSQVINPRIAAVLLTCIRFFAPIVLLMLISNDVMWHDYVPSFTDRIIRAASGWLLTFPYKFPSQLEYEWSAMANPEGALTPSALMCLNGIGALSVIGLAALQLIGWVMVPVTWGFYWRTRLQKHGSFWFAYFSYLVMPAGLAYINYLRVNTPPVGRVYPFYNWYGSRASSRIDMSYVADWGFHLGRFDWFWVLLYGLSGVLLSLILFVVTIRLWGRRKS